ncbi:MAG: tryptophan-rich sensory protein [Candidatus Bathyarchaeota archaeon]|nr:tryptophan-rich sensory protein [Candidatus Bathyarchaeota archaeon]
MSSKNQILKIANLIGFIVTIIVNGAANALPLNGVTTGELSDKYGNLFTPAGYVFSIWGVIYILLAAFTYYQYTSDDEELHEKIGWLFVASSFFNSIWIFFWHYEYLSLSLVAMVGLLGSLILIYTRLDIGLTEVSPRKRNMVHTTFSVYLGWITVAPIANVAAFLVDLGWDAYNVTAIYLTAAMILIALVLTVVNTYIRGDVAYATVLVWALGGIVQKQMNTWLLPWVAGFSILVIIIVLALKKMGRLG